MGFITSKRPSQLAKTLPRIKSGSRDQCKNVDHNLTYRKKSDAVFCKVEDIEIEKQIKLSEEMSMGNDCMWLSSDFNSLSLLVSDLSADIWELNSSNLSPKDKLREDSSVYESSFTSHSTMDDSSCSLWESDRTSMWISSLDINLKKDDDFSSPSHSSKVNSQSEFSYSSSNSATPFEASRSSSTELEYDEPLFWPYHKNSYKLSESDESCLSISPLKNRKMGITKEINGVKSAEVKLKKANSMPASRKLFQSPESSNQTPKRCATVRKKIDFSGKRSQNSSPLPPWSNRSAPQVSSRPVRSNSSTKERNSFSKKETNQLKLKSQTKNYKEFSKKHLLNFEACHFQESLVNGVSIEKMIGLNEFDGHEGLLNAGFSEDLCFTL